MFALLTFLLVEQIEDFLEPVRVVSCFRTTCALLGLYSTGGLTIIMWDRARRAGSDLRRSKLGRNLSAFRSLAHRPNCLPHGPLRGSQPCIAKGLHTG